MDSDCFANAYEDHFGQTTDSNSTAPFTPPGFIGLVNSFGRSCTLDLNLQDASVGIVGTGRHQLPEETMDSTQVVNLVLACYHSSSGFAQIPDTALMNHLTNGFAVGPCFVDTTRT